MWDDNLNRLVVNEIESLEACFGGTAKENDEVDSFLFEYWFNVLMLKLLPLIRLKTEHLRRAWAEVYTSYLLKAYDFQLQAAVIAGGGMHVLKLSA